ncbi:MAG: hypothetical protein LH609_07885 [Rudanella sp.]|nr:hypothetical protein [Rudanella sp.]
MKTLIFTLLATTFAACSANTKQESNSGQNLSTPVEKDYSDSARKPIVTDSVATDIRQ